MILSYWGSANKVTKKSLQVRYYCSYVRTYLGADIYECHRVATKSYSYVGMTEAAARACQEAKLAQYTRTFTQWYNDKGTYKAWESVKCVADIEVTHTSGNLWAVNINVNEDQMQYSRYNPVDASLFDLSLDYDEDTPKGDLLCITNIYRENSLLHVAYVQSIANFSRTSELFHVEQSTDGGGTWTTATPSSSTDGLLSFASGSWVPGLIRLRWGDSVISNAEATPADQYANTITLGTPLYSAGSWRILYDQDIRDFSPSNITVEASTDGTTWTYITDDCVISDGMVVTSQTSEEWTGYFRVSCGTASAVAKTPYDPAADVGDGRLQVLGAASNSESDTDGYWRITVVWTGAEAMTPLSLKTSTDGIAWEAVDFDDSYYSDAPGPTGTIVGRARIFGAKYCKFFSGSTQVSDVFALPYKAPGDSFWHRGLYLTSDGKTVFNYGATTPLVLPADMLGVQVSTDGGTTWTDLAGAANNNAFISSQNILNDYSACLCRFTYNGSPMAGAEKPNLAFPLACTPYNPAEDTGDGSLAVLGAYFDDGENLRRPDMILTSDVSGFDASLVSAKYSPNGMIWSNIQPVQDLSSGNRLYCHFTQIGTSAAFFKFFYDGVQATSAFVLPYPADGGDLFMLGLNADVSNISVAFGQTIAGFNASDLHLEASTDGGVTWTQISGSASYNSAVSRGYFVPSPAITDTTPRLFRLSYGDLVTQPVAYPLA